MILTIPQIRAARALLGWSQGDLALFTGLSKNGLSDLEQEKVLPRAQTIEKLRRAFEVHGVEFIEHDGVRMRRDIFKVNSFEGKNIFANYFQDLITVSRATGDVACHHSDDAEFSKNYPDEFFWYYSQMVKHKLKEKLLIPDNKLFRYSPYNVTECRMCPRDVFGTVGYSVYGDKFMLYIRDYMVIIENRDIAATYRQQFNFDWKRSAKMPPMKPLYERELIRRGKI